MSEYEIISKELQEVKSLLKTLLKKDEPEKEEWVSAEVACQMLHIKPATLASYRNKRMIEFRSPRPFQYSIASIEKLQNERIIKKAI